MSTADTTELGAGRELDAQVAERVMGIRLERGMDGPMEWPTDPTVQPLAPLRHYSTDIAAAWQVVEKMRERGFLYEVSAMVWTDGEHYASFIRAEKARVRVARMYDEPEPEPDAQATADTAPLAICRAALLAVQETEDA